MKLLKFKSQVCTTKEQSERLLAMGLSKATADMKLIPYSRFAVPVDYYTNIYGDDPDENDFCRAWSLHRLIEIANAMFDETAENLYDDIIATIQSFIHLGCLNEEYLDMDIVNANEEKNLELIKNGGK